MNQCQHDQVFRTRRICRHIDLEDYTDFYVRFSGRGSEYAVVCEQCQNTDWDGLNWVCGDCFEKAGSGTFNQVGVVGSPETMIGSEEQCVLEWLGSVEFPYRVIAGGKCCNRWLVLLENLSLYFVDPCGERSEQGGQITGRFDVDWTEPLDLLTSPDGSYVAITNRKGQHGLVWVLKEDRLGMKLDRGSYRPEHTRFPVCFYGHGDDTLLIAGTDWNRLDIFDPSSGGCLTPRDIKWEKNRPRPAHYLDYFMGELLISPNEMTLLIDGWVWQPVGVVGVVDLDAWRTGATFSCEDGFRDIRACAYLWGVAKAFLNDHEVVLWGFGNDALYMVDAAEVYDLRNGRRLRWFAGPPNASFVFGKWLFCFSPDHDTTAWDPQTGERVWHAPGHRAAVYNRNSQHFLAWSGKTLQVSKWYEKHA